MKIKLIIFFCFITTFLFAYDIQVSWDSMSTATGYKLYIGGQSRSYTNVIDVGNLSTFKLTGLTQADVYLAVTEYDASTKESDFSTEISYTPAVILPTNIIPIVTNTSPVLHVTTGIKTTTNPTLPNSVILSWDTSTDSNIMGYQIMGGIISGNYTIFKNTDLVTSYTFTNLLSNTNYYFVVREFNTTWVTGPMPQNETIWISPPTIPLKITYVGVKVDYGTNLVNLLSQSTLVFSVTNNPGYFYSEVLIITNNPFSGIKPVDGNKYVYLGAVVKYGTNITQLNSITSGLFTLTNPPAYFYRSSLILTNHIF